MKTPLNPKIMKTPSEPQNKENPLELPKNEDSSDPQTTLVNDGMSGGIVRFTVPSDGMNIISPKTLHDKFSPQVVMNKISVKRVDNIEQ